MEPMGMCDLDGLPRTVKVVWVEPITQLQMVITSVTAPQVYRVIPFPLMGTAVSQWS